MTDFESRHTASVSIDGESIRQIREEKRLTQLYVAKVVGVTTDTVSRWENNRYPTIRRDNAIKLAEALEVELDDILKQEDPPETDTTSPSEVVKQKPIWLYVVLAAVVVAVLFLFFQNGGIKSSKIIATRIVSPYAAPGSRVLIRVHLVSETPLKGMILRENYPSGWKLVASEPPASGLDNEIGKARWIFRKPQQQTSVAYLLEVPAEAKVGESIKIHGELIANPDGQESSVPLQAVGEMQVQPFHWADLNGNAIIEDLEILDVSELLEETGKLHIDWDLIETLWDAGGYQWDPKDRKFVPLQPGKLPAP